MDLASFVQKQVSAEHLYEHLRYQVKELGYRPTGSKNSMKLVEYISAKFEDYGLEVSRESFPMYIPRVKKCRLTLLNDKPVDVFCLPVFVGNYAYWMHEVKTPETGLFSKVVFCGEGLSRDYEGKDVSGKIVLVQHSERASPIWQAYEATQHDGVGLIHISDALDEISLRSPWPLRGLDPHASFLFPGIPAVTITQTAGNNLKEVMRKGEVKARLNLDVSEEKVHGINVTGKLRCLSDNEEVGVYAHHDSPGEREHIPGAYDNGSGVAVLLETARVISSLAETGTLKLRRTMRFVAYDAEEYNAIGCWSLALNLTPFMDKTEGRIALFGLLYGLLYEKAREDVLSNYLIQNSLKKEDLQRMKAIFETDNTGKGKDIEVNGTREFFEKLVAKERIRNMYGDRIGEISVQEGYGGNIPMYLNLVGFKVPSLSYRQRGVYVKVHTIHDNLENVDIAGVKTVAELYALSVSKALAIEKLAEK